MIQAGARANTRRRRHWWRTMAITVMAITVGAITPNLALADLAPGSWVFSGSVADITATPDAAYVGGAFSQQQAPTGAGLIVPASGAGTPDPSAFPKVIGSIGATVADGSGGWFVGGGFSEIGGVVRQNLAHVLANGTVDAAWHPNTDGYVSDLALSGSTLYLGGDFEAVAAQPRHHLAALSASTGQLTAWNPDPSGGFDLIHDLAVAGTTVYVGGDFSTISGQPRQSLAAVNATTGAATAWNPNPSGGFNDVLALTVSASTVYVSGDFTAIGGQARTDLAAFDIASGDITPWNPNPNDNANVSGGLAVSGTTVYVGGDFSTIGGQARSGLAALDATTGNATAWNPSPDQAIDHLWTAGSAVYATGDFTTIGGQTRRNLAALDTGSGNATPWNPSPSSNVNALAVSGASVYVGGDFAGAGPPRASVRGVARVLPDGTLDTDWHPNPIGNVNALAVSGSTLYVGGFFSSIGGQARGNLAAVDRTTGTVGAWNPNADFGGINDLAVVGSSTVYANGFFSTIGGQPRNGLAALSASTGQATTWNPDGCGCSMFDLAVAGSTVFVGGFFSSLAGQPRNFLAGVDTTTGQATAWNPNPNDYAQRLAVAGSTVYAAGSFASIGGQSRQGLAALNATSGTATAWNPSPNGFVSALAATGSTVYVGGGFSAVGGQSRGGLAALDPTTGSATAWNHRLGGGIPWALAVSGSTVYAGGDFVAADGEVTGPFAVLGSDQVSSFTLSVTKVGQGTVSSSPGGISCGGSCSASYSSGASVSLSATPAAGYEFAGFSGAPGCSGTSCTVSMTQARAVTATFRAVPPGPPTPPVTPPVVSPPASHLPTPEPPPPAAQVAPRLSSVRLKSGKPVVVSLRLDRAARVTLSVVRKRGGVRSGRRCVKPKAGSAGRRCDLRLMRVSRSLPAGANSIRMGRRLSPGRYRLTVVARAGGEASRAVVVGLRVRDKP